MNADTTGQMLDRAAIAVALDIDKRSVARRAVREQWPYTEEETQGGKRRLYALKDLPEEVNNAVLLRRHSLGVDLLSGAPLPERGRVPAASAASAATPGGSGGGAVPGWNRPVLSHAEAWERYEKATQARKDEAGTRLRAVLRLEELLDAGVRTMQARAQVVAEMKAEGVKGATGCSLWRWQGVVKGVPRADWLAMLTPGYWGRGPKCKVIDATAWEEFKSDYLRVEQPSAASCYERALRGAQARGVALPTLDTFKRRLKAEVSRGALILGRQGAEAFAQTIPALERDRTVYHAMEAVNVDGHQADVFVHWPEVPSGKEIMRPVLIGIQDIYSGLILGWRVGWSETTELAQQAFHAVVQRYGIPGKVWMDNGRAFASKELTGRVPTRYRYTVRADEPLGALPALGCAIRWTQPYHGQSKPIERAWRDFCDRFSKHPAFAGAYTGNHPQAKPENYQSRAVPIEEFVRVLDREVRAHNERVGRRTPVCEGRLSFQQAFDASYAQATVPKASAAQLRMLLQATEVVHANRKSGMVTVAGNKFWSEALSALAGQRVQVRFDAEAIQAGVEVYTLDGVYVGEAGCKLPVGFEDRDQGREARKLRAERRDVARRELKLHRKLEAAELGRRQAALGLDVAEPEVLAPALNRRRRRARRREEMREAAGRLGGEHIVCAGQRVGEIDSSAQNADGTKSIGRFDCQR